MQAGRFDNIENHMFFFIDGVFGMCVNVMGLKSSFLRAGFGAEWMSGFDD